MEHLTARHCPECGMPLPEQGCCAYCATAEVRALGASLREGEVTSAAEHFPRISKEARAYLTDCVRTALVAASSLPELHTRCDRANYILGWLMHEASIPETESESLLQGEWP
jgi:uncharacterized Zn finger protein (UPF0148 family)